MLRTTQPIQQIGSLLQLKVNRSGVGITQPFHQRVPNNLTGTAHAVAVDVVTPLKKGEHGSHAAGMLATATGEWANAEKFPQRRLFTLHFVVEVQPYPFGFISKRQHGWFYFAGFRIDILLACHEFLATRPVGLQARVVVAFALQSFWGKKASAGDAFRAGEQEARQKTLCYQ
ncbi:hypothetical protein D9M71_583800 [compost metagenome]